MGRFRYQSALLIATALALASVALFGQSTFKVDVKLVRLLVTVKDSKGTLMGSLEKPDFTVFDSGVKQEVAVFEHHTALPLSVALLIDTSGSTARICVTRPRRWRNFCGL
jgi:Ca-activated chloride channel family protein